MTTLDPSHIPSHSDNPRHGGAVHESVSPLHFLSRRRPPPSSVDESSDDDDHPDAHGPPWRGAWARRQEARQNAKKERKDDARKDGKIPVPPIPDLRFEQGVLMSIRPFLHRVETGSGGTGEAKQTVRTEKDVEKIEAEEKTAFVSEAFTAEGAKEGLAKGEQSDIFSGPLRVQWGQVAYIIIRDQVIYPLLQGLVWGVGGLWLASLWDWNKSRIAAGKSAGGSKRAAGAGLLARLGIHR